MLSFGMVVSGKVEFRKFSGIQTGERRIQIDERGVRKAKRVVQWIQRNSSMKERNSNRRADFARQVRSSEDSAEFGLMSTRFVSNKDEF